MTFLDKARLLQTTVLGGLMFAAAPVYAQDNQPIDETVETTTVADDVEVDEDDRDTIVVTGSRLRRSEFTSASPLQVIDGELARDLGLVDAADLLGQTTVVQGQQFTTGVSTSAGLLSDSGPGSSTASLRGLDASRTLVLINGRRLAPAGVRGAPSAPDLNLIPGTLIERVDVLLDGASSIYGSDAVAGVVNYQLRRDFEGLQFDAYATLPELPGNAGHQEVYTVSAGVSDDNGFMSFAVEHSETDGFAESALSSFYSPYAGGCLSNVVRGGGGTGTLYETDNCVGFFGAGSASTPFGFLAFSPGTNIPGLAPNFRQISTANANLIQPDDPDGQALLIYPEEFNAAFAPDFERTSLFSFGEYDTGLYGDMTAYFEASYSERRTSTNTAGQGVVRLPSDYALSSFGGGGASSLYYGSTFVNDTEVGQMRLVGGFKGDLPFMEKVGLSNWAYDAYASYSRSKGQDSVQGVPYLPRLEQTLANTTIDPATGEAVCGSRSVPGISQTIDCRPLNFFETGFLFGGRFDDPEDTEYLFPNRLTDTEVRQTVYQAYVGGDLFDIPTGDTILVGFGAEFRKDFIETKTSLAGEFQGFFNDPGSNGERDLTEVFGEIELPLVTDKPFVHLLNVNLAARYTDESNFGAEETYSVKGQYAPTDWLTFRGTYGTSYRAPGLGEQFGGRVTGFGAANDPCLTPGFAVPFDDYDNDPTTPNTREYVPSLDTRDPNLIQNCLNGGGPFGLPGTNPFNLGIRGLGTQNPVFTNPLPSVASGSNPDLDPETSEAFTIGGTFDMPWFDAFDLRVAVTYFNIEIDGEIDALTSGTIINRCYNSPGLTDPTCEFITRDPLVAGDDTSGNISFVSALNQNLGKQTVDGIDYNVELGLNFEDFGINLPVDYAFIGRATQSLTQDEEEFVVDGTLINRALGEYGNPEWRFNLTNRFRYKDFQVLFQSRYIGSQVENFLNIDDPATGRVAGQVDIDPVTSGFSKCVQTEGRGSLATGGFNCLQEDGLDDYWVHAVSVAYAKDTFVARVGVNNVFNDAPPLTTNNDLGSLGGIGYDTGGRTFFMNLTKRF